MNSDQQRAIKVLNDNAAQIEQLYHRLESNPSHPAWPQVEQAIAAHREAGTAFKDGQPSTKLTKEALWATKMAKWAVKIKDPRMCWLLVTLALILVATLASFPILRYWFEIPTEVSLIAALGIACVVVLVLALLFWMVGRKLAKK